MTTTARFVPRPGAAQAVWGLFFFALGVALLLGAPVVEVMTADSYAEPDWAPILLGFGLASALLGASFGCYGLYALLTVRGATTAAEPARAAQPESSGQ
ncbi:hypothetical protein [Cellulosimicrobium sp. 22601]|uniref:hypothetical protein n=1 Tax=unclassified Cellulosimicrobium TaxID=2624466 RepID=UPI003F857042